MSKAVRELVPLFEVKMELIDYLKSRESEGLSWTGVGAGLLLDWVSFLSSMCIWSADDRF
jgi:hypothetical protein